jgi:hypothetical protein
LEKLFRFIVIVSYQVYAGFQSQQIGDYQMFGSFYADGEGIGKVAIDARWCFFDYEKNGDVIDHY